MKTSTLAGALSMVCLDAGLAMATPMQDGDRGALWARLPWHLHSARDLRHAHVHALHNGVSVIPQYGLHGSFSVVSYSGPFPLERETHSTAKLIVHSETHGQYSLQFNRDAELGLLDHSLASSFRLPLTSSVTLSGGAEISLDSTVNPTLKANVAPSYTLFFIPQGQIFGAISGSLEAARYRTGDTVTVNPMLSIGSLAAGITVSAGYTFGRLANAQPTATLLSKDQASITTGPSMSLNWKVNPQLSVALSLLPRNESVTLFSTSTETTVRTSASYRLESGWQVGVSAQKMRTRAKTEFLNRSLEIETFLTVSF